MKILHISTHDDGGAALGAINLHHGLLKVGVDSTILFLERSDVNSIDQSIYCNEGLVDGVLNYKEFSFIRKLNKRFLKWNLGPFTYFETGIKLKGDFLEQFDIINLHWVSNFFDWNTFFKRVNVPIVWTQHDLYLKFGGLHFNIDKQGSHPMVNIFDELLRRKKRRLISEKAELITIVSPSAWLKNELNGIKEFSKINKSVIPYGYHSKSENSTFDVNEIKQRYGIPKGKRILIDVIGAPYKSRKGFQFLSEIISGLRDTVVLHVGKPVENGSENLVSIGIIKDKNQLFELLAISSATLLPSVEDNLPNVMIESLLSGTPVLGFKIGGLIDTIKNGFNGLLSLDLTSEGLQKVIDESAEIDFNRVEIQRWAEDYFSSQNRAKDYLEIYKKLL